uniref:DDHD domain-containing protein n=1 Tax=Strigamia maritima TaxID=126957 RepID=T1JJI2_STRMM
MLIKEYRIALPLSVEEYRIAQLYMIAKKSREETRGAGSGIEILVNEPYTQEGGGSGQFTHKIYHIGSHLPGWFKALLPKSALTVEERAWNSYPYTKTRYTCPFVEKFSLEIETKYFNDCGNQDNVFGLDDNDLRSRIVDTIDVVRDAVSGTDYRKEEDPRFYVSQKTGRGPLPESWLDEFQYSMGKGQQGPLPDGRTIMCAYKLCRVEFRYWGMQSKIEKFIHDIALRKTMLRAHRQAWAWQDEWFGLTMEDIRRLEKETQDLLAKKMASTSETSLNTVQQEEEKEEDEGKSTALVTSSGSTKSFDLAVANWKMESIVRDSGSSSDDEYFDCEGSDGIPTPDIKLDDDDYAKLTNWSSMELISGDDTEQTSPVSAASTVHGDSIFHQSFVNTLSTERARSFLTSCSMDQSLPCSPTLSPAHQACSVTVLVLVLHAGSVLDTGADHVTKKSDVTTFRSAFENVMKLHYPSMMGHIAMRLVPCPIICSEALAVLSSLSPYSFESTPSPSAIDGSSSIHNDTVPLGAIPLFATAPPEYQDHVSKVIYTANQVYNEFIHSDDGQGFIGQVSIVADSVGSVLAYDALCRVPQFASCFGSESSILEGDLPPLSPGVQAPRSNPLISISDGSSGSVEDAVDELVADQTSRRRYQKSFSHPGDAVAMTANFNDFPSSLQIRHLQTPNRRKGSCSSDQAHAAKLDFEVHDLFMFGAPLSLVLAFRKLHTCEDKNMPPMRPMCSQVYNLFHPTDPLASRIEPLVSARFSMVQPVNVARYAKYPLGDGQPYHLLECIQSNAHLFSDMSVASLCNRRTSEVSIQMTHKWWGVKRMDYALYCPEGLANFPTNALPHLFHASYWESSDVIAFVIRQLARGDSSVGSGSEEKEFPLFSPTQPREKWLKKKTSVKLKNVSANHRANDVIVREGVVQVLSARFVYGPLDLVSLSGEKVDIHVMNEGGDWTYLSTETADKNGRVTYTIPKEKALGFGIYPVKAMVRGDHTSVDFYLAVVPPKTECVAFSIDGSFTASVSVTGRDPKVRAGAVDVVRHWQELGYLIVYVTGRPDMQQHKVVAWLAQHNFPHGLVSFVDGLSTDPLRHKAEHLRYLINEADVVIHAAYGSSKDIAVYTSIGIKPDRIFIVGKVSKKQHSLAQILSDGYAAHLSDLTVPGGSRPAQGNARMVIPKGCFGLTGHGMSLRRRRSAKRTTSYPISAVPGQHHNDSVLWARGIAPRSSMGARI